MNVLKQSSEGFTDSLNNDLPVAQQQKKKYDKAGNEDPHNPYIAETLSLLRSVNNKVDHKTFKSLCELMEAYMSYFEQGNFISPEEVENHSQ